MSEDRFVYARSLSTDIHSATIGVSLAYRDIEAVESFHAEHDRLHNEAEAKGEHYDCRAASAEFWGTLSRDVITSDDLVAQAVHRVVLARLLMERQVREGEVGFIILEPQREDETEDQYVARIVQTMQDDKDIQAMSVEDTAQPVNPITDEEVAEFVNGLANFMAEHPVSGDEMPTGDETDDDDPTTKIEGE